MAGKGFMKKCQTEVKRCEIDLDMATQGLLPAKVMTKRQQWFLFSTTELYSHTQSSTF